MVISKSFKTSSKFYSVHFLSIPLVCNNHGFIEIQTQDTKLTSQRFQDNDSLSIRDSRSAARDLAITVV